MSDKIKAMVIDDGGFMEAIADLGGHRVIELTVEHGWNMYHAHKRFVSPWEETFPQETAGRQPGAEANISSDRLAAPPEDQKDPVSSTGGVGLPAVTYDSGGFIIPQPVDPSPARSGQAQPPGTFPPGDRAAETSYTTIVCRYCGGRGTHFATGVIEECAICLGGGYQSIKIGATA